MCKDICKETKFCDLVNKLWLSKRKVCLWLERFIYAQAASAKQGKNLMTGHILVIAATRGNLYSRWMTVIIEEK